MSDDIVERIDLVLRDHAVGPDAMRWIPDADPADLEPARQAEQSHPFYERGAVALTTAAPGGTDIVLNRPQVIWFASDTQIEEVEAGTAIGQAITDMVSRVDIRDPDYRRG